MGNFAYKYILANFGGKPNTPAKKWPRNYTP